VYIRKFMGWEDCSISDYTQCCNQFGYNSESSARFLTFFLNNGAALKFLAYRRKGELSGAVCLDNGWIANDYKNPKMQTGGMPLPAFCVIPPFKENVQCVAPFKSKSLSAHTRNFRNASFNLFSRRQVAYSRCLREGFSKKVRYNRNREVRNFLESGGEFVDVGDISSAFLHDSYHQLFAKRRQKQVKLCETTKSFFSTYHNDFFGKIALWRGDPVGVQLLITSTSKLGFFVDFINIGYDTDIRNHSLGTIMMWNNLVSAHEHAERAALPLHFSYGMMSGEYKSMWCTPQNTGRIVTLLG